MPPAKKRRVEDRLDDSFDEPDHRNLNDSFDEGAVIEQGPPLVIEIKQTQMLQTQQVLTERQITGYQGVEEKPPFISNRPPTNVLPSQNVSWNRTTNNLQSQRPQPVFTRSSSTNLTQTANKMTKMEFDNGKEQESGLVMMLRKQAENKERKIDDMKREKSVIVQTHIQERNNLERQYQQKVKELTQQRDQLKRQVLSMSMRGDTTMNMTADSVDLNTSVGNRSVLPVKPVETRSKNDRLAWMRSTKCTPNVQSSVFRHNSGMNETYQHVSTQMMSDSLLVQPPRMAMPKMEPRTIGVAMTSIECQTECEDDIKEPELPFSSRDSFLEKLLSTALQMSESEFSLQRIEPLIGDKQSLTMRRRPEQPRKPTSKRIS